MAYNVGDIYRMGSSGCAYIQEGEEVVITDDGILPCYTSAETPSDSCCGHEGDLTFIRHGERPQEIPHGGFQVGDEVRGISADVAGGTGIVEELRDDGEMLIRMTTSAQGYRAGDLTISANWTKEIELISRKEGDIKMSDVLQGVRDLNLTGDDELLVKHNISDRTGALTETGKDVVLQLLFNENQQVVVDAITKLDAKNAKAKKEAK